MVIVHASADTARHAKQLDKTTEIEILKADLEERGFNIKVSFSIWVSSEVKLNAQLTVIDTPGFGDYVNNRDRSAIDLAPFDRKADLLRSWTPIVDFIDDQHESYMRQEQQPHRQDKQDLRVHACLYFIKPGTSYAQLPDSRHTRTRADRLG
jgi:cell division control protein 12